MTLCRWGGKTFGRKQIGVSSIVNAPTIAMTVLLMGTTDGLAVRKNGVVIVKDQDLDVRTRPSIAMMVIRSGPQDGQKRSGSGVASMSREDALTIATTALLMWVTDGPATRNIGVADMKIWDAPTNNSIARMGIILGIMGGLLQKRHGAARMKIAVVPMIAFMIFQIGPGSGPRSRKHGVASTNAWGVRPGHMIVRLACRTGSMYGPISRRCGVATTRDWVAMHPCLIALTHHRIGPS